MNKILEAYKESILNEKTVQAHAKAGYNAANRKTIDMALKAQIKKRDVLKAKGDSKGADRMNKTIERTRAKLKKYD